MEMLEPARRTAAASPYSTTHPDILGFESELKTWSISIPVGLETPIHCRRIGDPPRHMGRVPPFVLPSLCRVRHHLPSHLGEKMGFE